VTAQKILQAGLWWLTIFKDAKDYPGHVMFVKGLVNHHAQG
jgi:hypothetical protein